MFQCVLLLNADRKMYHAETDTPFVCRTTRLNEELGQVGRRPGARSGAARLRVGAAQRGRALQAAPPRAHAVSEVLPALPGRQSAHACGCAPLS